MKRMVTAPVSALRSARLAGLFLGFLGTAASPLHAQLLVNGSFENPTLPSGGTETFSTGQTVGAGWTVVGPSVLLEQTNYGEPYTNVNQFNAEDGLNGLDLTGPANQGPNCGVQQVVATAPGQSYHLTFYVGTVTPTDGPEGQYTGVATDNLSINGGALISFTNSNRTNGSQNWQQFSYDFTATGASTTLTFLNGTANSSQAGLDNVVLTGRGAAYGWGYNGYGQLGTNATTNSNFSYTPVAATGLSTGVTAIASGGIHSLALQNGAVYAYGDNSAGELGNGTTTQSTTPVAVTGLSSGVTAIAAGASHSLAVQNGAAYAWGANESGELGNGTAANSSVPVAVNGLTSGVTAVAGGYQHSLAIQNGAAYAWGLNSNGQLGNGTTTNSSAPMAVMGLSSGVTAIAGGFSHSLAIQNGAAYAWGANGYYQLGNGSYANSNTPVAVSGLSSGVTAVAAGYSSSMAVQNGNVFAWGTNNNGLGNGTTVSATPVEIDPTDLKNIIAVAAGEHDSYALSGDGSLWVWGDNTYGQLGLGNTTAYATPQHLLPPSGYEYTAIDADAYGYFADAILTPVPEPATWLGGALLLAPAGLALHRRWHRVIGNRPAA